MAYKTKQMVPLGKQVYTALEEYFNKLDGCKITNFYEIFLKEVEPPLLKTVMKHAKNKQCNAAVMLGLNRGTLRKKLNQYKLDVGK